MVRLRLHARGLAAFLFATAVLPAAQAQQVASPPPAPPSSSEKLIDARPGELRVFASGAMLATLEAARAKTEQAIGHRLRIEYGSARGNLKSQIAKGQGFDVAILPADVIRELRGDNKVQAKQYPILRVPLAIGLRGDVASPDISTSGAFRAALLGARSVKYSPGGAIRTAIDHVLSSLDVASRIKDSSAVREPVSLAAGEYEIRFFPLSEIAQNRDVRYLGTAPASLDADTPFDAVLAPAANVAASRTFIKVLRARRSGRYTLSEPAEAAGSAASNKGM